jgi:hypothetical protein
MLRIVLVVILSFIIGVSVSMLHENFSRSGYNVGIVPFCDLIEIDRLKVCPMVRRVIELPTGGSLIIYACNTDFMYVETNSLSEVSKKKLYEKFERYRNNNIIKKECKSKLGIVYSVRKKTYND